jgi:hypothetical protein
MQAFKPVALPRVVVWAGLALFTVYSGIELLAGPGRDIAFRDVTWTPAAVAQVVTLIILLAGLFALAAYTTYRNEVATPPPGTLRFSGAPLGVLSEGFLTVVAGVLLLGFAYCTLRIPEGILVSHDPRYASYESASPAPMIMFGAIAGVFGFFLIVLRRYVWELRPGQPVRRFWSLAFSRGRVIEQPLRVYWTQYFTKRGYNLIPRAWWLRVVDPTSKGTFRDGSLVLVPLATTPYELANIEQAWRASLAGHGARLAPTEMPVPTQNVAQLPCAVPA